MNDPITQLNAALRNRYRIVRELGRGGMGTVYLADDLRHDRKVAMKVLRPEVAAVVGAPRFLAEIRTTAQLQHPGILPLHDSGEVDGLLYYVMPYAAGETLEERLKGQGPLPVREAVRIAVDVAQALDVAHERGVIHRDVKPANILLSHGRPLLADFGIALALKGSNDRLTEAGLTLGTPHYMSPEQIVGDEVGPRSDIYSLGCVLYEMLAGAPPFQTDSGRAVLAAQLATPLPRLPHSQTKVPSTLLAAVQRATAKDPGDRFPSAGAFADALEASLVPAGRGPGSWSARRRIAVAATVVVLVVLGGLLGRRSRPTEGPDPNRVVVFPLVVSDGFPGPPTAGEDLATIIGTALDGTGPLRWIDGWAQLPPRLREDIRNLTNEEARALTLERNSARYLTGRVSALGDSALVSLVLSDARGSEDAVRAQATAPLNEPWRAVGAVNLLLPSLVPGVDANVLEGWARRPPRAVASYLLAEAAFRRLRVDEALDHYRAAVASDSTFATAAVRGAQAASWTHRAAEASRLLELAARQPLEPRYDAFVRGYRAYLRGEADSALSALRRAVSVDPDFAPAWLQLGETWTHLLPSAGVPDDSALFDFRQVMRADSTATNALLHTVEILLRLGDVQRAAPLVDRLAAWRPEGSYADSGEKLTVMLECVRDGPDPQRWARLATEDPFAAFQASHQLSGGGAQMACAEAGYSALLGSDTTSDVDAESRRFFTLLGYETALLARGETAEARSALEAFVEKWGSGSSLYFLLAPWYPSFADGARQVAREDSARYGPGYERLTFTNRLWEAGVFEARVGDPGRAVQIAADLRRRGSLGEPAHGALLAESIEVHLDLREGRTEEAGRRLPTLLSAAVPDVDLTYDEALPFGGERLEYARILAADGDYQRAIEVADMFDSPLPWTYSLYLLPSLELRAEAAAAQGDIRSARAYRARLEALDGEGVP